MMMMHRVFEFRKFEVLPEERLPPNAKIPEEITHTLSRQV
jgi:hypothetical protein